MSTKNKGGRPPKYKTEEERQEARKHQMRAISKRYENKKRAEIKEMAKKLKELEEKLSTIS